MMKCFPLNVVSCRLISITFRRETLDNARKLPSVLRTVRYNEGQNDFRFQNVRDDLSFHAQAIFRLLE